MVKIANMWEMAHMQRENMDGMVGVEKPAGVGQN